MTKQVGFPIWGAQYCSPTLTIHLHTLLYSGHIRITTFAELSIEAKEQARIMLLEQFINDAEEVQYIVSQKLYPHLRDIALIIDKALAGQSILQQSIIPSIPYNIGVQITEALRTLYARHATGCMPVFDPERLVDLITTQESLQYRNEKEAFLAFRRKLARLFLPQNIVVAAERMGILPEMQALLAVLQEALREQGAAKFAELTYELQSIALDALGGLFNPIADTVLSRSNVPALPCQLPSTEYFDLPVEAEGLEIDIHIHLEVYLAGRKVCSFDSFMQFFLDL